jgi:Domain of unknown function (DUF6048)
MMILMQNTYKYIISTIVFCVLLAIKTQAQNNGMRNANDANLSKVDSTIKVKTDSSKLVVDTNIIKTDSNAIANDSIKHKKAKWYKNWTPIGIYVGADVAKVATSLADKNNIKIESIIDIYCKNTNWIGVNVGYTSSSFGSANLQYSSRSSGALFTMQKSLFPFVYNSDRDNAFIGIGYGLAFNRIGEAIYKTNDIWGATNGIINANNNTAHFVELNAGFRMAITKHIMIGWRMQGKTILNSKIFTDIAPITIANYGSGDKSAVFGYNLAVTYRVF